MNASNLQIITGEDKTIPITWNGPSSPLDITGSTMWFTIKENRNDSDANAIFQLKWNPVTGSGYDTTKGQTYITIPSASSTNFTAGIYFFDIRLKSNGGQITSSLPGVIEVIEGITQATS